jgi:membrane protease YdiL (CAAX protease family)
LGWRIFLFLFLTRLVMVALSMVIPPHLPYGSVPLLVGCVVAGWALLRMDGRGPGALGFYLARGIGKEAFLGLLLGVAVAGLVTAGMVMTGGLRWVPEGGSVQGYFWESGAALWLFSLPAAAEEAAMRGYLLQALSEAWGGGWGLWVTSLLFGIMHLGNPNSSWIGLANILVAGLLLGVIYLRTGSLWWATGAHLGWNWAHGFLFDLPVSGIEVVDTPLLEPVIRGPGWVTGGPFGPEGSLLATVVLSVSALVLWKSSWLKPGVRAREVRPLFLAGEP